MKFIVGLIVGAIVMRVLIEFGTPYPLALVTGALAIGFTEGAMGSGSRVEREMLELQNDSRRLQEGRIR